METKEIQEKINKISNVISETPVCKSHVENAVKNLDSAINILLDSVDAHDLLHGECVQFMAANALHGMVTQLRQIS